MEQCGVIDDFFCDRHATWMVRLSKSPHHAPAFCLKEATWQAAHFNAYHKLFAATVVTRHQFLKGMGFRTSWLDVPGSVHLTLSMITTNFMRASYISLASFSTSSGIFWEWLVMPQGLPNATATFNRILTHLFIPRRGYRQTYFDEILPIVVYRMVVWHIQSNWSLAISAWVHAHKWYVCKHI